mmetsp:Transcript_132390/g.264089  ORF Transcript_132390/g.264089 Transcript_132390/m.264089 type:complete len:204 (-) Transcript_132390:198-809(-)
MFVEVPRSGLTRRLKLGRCCLQCITKGMWRQRLSYLDAFTSAAALAAAKYLAQPNVSIHVLVHGSCCHRWRIGVLPLPPLLWLGSSTWPVAQTVVLCRTLQNGFALRLDPGKRCNQCYRQGAMFWAQLWGATFTSVEGMAATQHSARLSVSVQQQGHGNPYQTCFNRVSVPPLRLWLAASTFVGALVSKRSSTLQNVLTLPSA